MHGKSKAQYRLMEAVKRNPKFAKKAGIPQSVGEEYAAADAGTSYNALPERVKNAPKGGKMSSAAVKTKLGVVRKPAPKPVKKPKG